MSWDKTYSHTVLLAIDRLGAALIFNQADITISSLCWIVLQHDAAHARAEVDPLDQIAFEAITKLKLSGWQLWLLRTIGNDLLERFWPGHCARARQGDLQTGERARQLLTGPEPA